jgi:hypothetical protein
MDKMKNDELVSALTEFVGAFETVFRYDWPYTRLAIGDEADGATFIEPRLLDEFEDWASRGFLLEKYRILVQVMKDRGLAPQFPIPLERVPGFKCRVW